MIESEPGTKYKTKRKISLTEKILDWLRPDLRNGHAGLVLAEMDYGLCW